MTVMFLAPGLQTNFVPPPSIKLSSGPPYRKKAKEKRLAYRNLEKKKKKPIWWMLYYHKEYQLWKQLTLIFTKLFWMTWSSLPHEISNGLAFFTLENMEAQWELLFQCQPLTAQFGGRKEDPQAGLGKAAKVGAEAHVNPTKPISSNLKPH